MKGDDDEMRTGNGSADESENNDGMHCAAVGGESCFGEERIDPKGTNEAAQEQKNERLALPTNGLESDDPGKERLAVQLEKRML